MLQECDIFWLAKMAYTGVMLPALYGPPDEAGNPECIVVNAVGVR